MFQKLNKATIIILLLTLVGGFLHFYNLNWGAPYYFNPDERNIASAVSQLQFPHQMNPHFFAYGSLPIYVIYFTGLLAQALATLQFPSLNVQLSFSNAIIVSRVYSALFATLLIPLLFSLGKKLKNETAGLLAASFGTMSIGFIQFAHFGTFEMWLTFFGVLLFWLCLHYGKNPTYPLLVVMAITFGVLVAVKISSLALLPIPLLILIASSFQKHRITHHTNKNAHAETQIFRKSDVRSLLSFLKNILLFLIIAAIVYSLTNPYVILDTKDFLSSMNYESSIALGTMNVFYTGNFLDTVPVIYQFLHVYPFLINPFITFLFIPSFIFLIIQTIKTKNAYYLLLVTFYLLLFLSQTALFVKWTRYMMPTVPFVILTVAIALAALLQKEKTRIRASFVGVSLLLIFSSIFALSYIKTTYFEVDSRLAALLYAEHSIPVDATILTETADLGTMPFQDAFPHLVFFNFYDYENNAPNATEEQLQQQLASAQYIILPSQRILQSRIENPKRFPKGNKFYESLLNGELGFQKIYETPCDVFCSITYLNDPVYWWEQTSSVFDHPTVFIFKKES